MCQDECRSRNDAALKQLVYEILGYEGPYDLDSDTLPEGASALDIFGDAFPYDIMNNITGQAYSPDSPSRRRRGVLPSPIQHEISRFLRETTRCADAKLKQRDGLCVCTCKSEPLQLKCDLIKDGGFQFGTSWQVDHRGQATSQSTNDQCFVHQPSPLPLGNYNYQCLTAGTDIPFPFGPPPDQSRDMEGKVALSQVFKVPRSVNHAFLLYGMQPGVIYDYGFLMLGPHAQAYRVDIMKQKSPPFSTDKDDTVDTLVAGRGWAPPNLYLHDLTETVARSGGKFKLRYMVSNAFQGGQTMAVDHVHMCTVRCGGPKKTKKEA